MQTCKKVAGHLVIAFRQQIESLYICHLLLQMVSMSLNPRKICFPGQSTSRRRLGKVERNKNGKKVESFTQCKFWLPKPDSLYPSTKKSIL